MTPVKARELPVRLSTLRAQVDDEIGAAIRLAIRAAYKHRADRPPTPDAESAIVEAAVREVGLVLDAWLDWGEG